MRYRARAHRAFIAVVLAAHAALLAWSATRHSPTYDEVAWLPAGLSHWELGRFDLARVNPPLVRMVAAVPVALAEHRSDWKNYVVSPGGRPEFQVGIDFMRANGARSFWLFTIARWMCIPFSLVGAWICYRWASALYGSVAGCLSLTLWCFCPNVLAHGELITSDVAAAALGCAACYAFWSWLRAPSPDMALMCGLLLGIAELTKTTWLLLFVLWPALWLVWRVSSKFKVQGSKRPADSSKFKVEGSKLAEEEIVKTQDLRPKTPELNPKSKIQNPKLIQMAVMLGVALVTLNLEYGFEGTFKPLGKFPFVSRALTVDDPRGTNQRVNRFEGSWIGKLPVPLPENYLLGIDETKAEFDRGKRSYLHGQWKVGGWWYYYSYGLAVKVPLGTWLLGILAVALTARCRNFRERWRDELVLLAPAASVLVLISWQAGSNALRYVLPAFPFVFVWMGKIALPPSAAAGANSDAPLRHTRERKAYALLRIWLAGAALLWSVLSCLSVYPHCLAYFNALGGGPLGGHAHLVGSNIDWGQDLLYLRSWLDEHPEARPLRLAYFGQTDPKLAGIDFQLPPSVKPDHAALSTNNEGPLPGWHAVSVSYLRGFQIPAFDATGRQVPVGSDDYTYFLQLQPVAVAGRSIYIYHITETEANRVRAQLGLPLLNG